MKARAGNVRVELCIDDARLKLNTILFEDDVVFITEN